MTYFLFRVQGSGFRVQGSVGSTGAVRRIQTGKRRECLGGDAQRSLDSRFPSYRQPSPRGEGAPKGRIGHWRHERERGGSSQVGDIREHPSAAARSPFPNGEGKEEAASPQKRKPTPPRCAQQPLPREGARVDAPSFLWKEVPRRGGGWRGKRYPRHTAFPSRGRCPEGADRALAG